MDHIEAYFTGLKATIASLKSEQALHEPINAYRFNPFSFWPVGENKASELLAHFLDPAKGHGQGDIFLKLFLKKFGLEKFVTDTINVGVRCEHAIPRQRRIDILLSFYTDRFAIAIENKIDAGDQENQLHDYNEYLKSVFKEKYILFYLTPHRLPPTGRSISKENYDMYAGAGAIQLMSYSADIIGLIKDWQAACRAERVRYFLKELEQYFKRLFLGETFMDEHKFVTDYAISTKENLEAAFQTHMAYQSIKTVIGTRFTKALTERLKLAFTGEWTVEQRDIMNVIVNNSNWPVSTYIGICDFDRDRAHFNATTDNQGKAELYNYLLSKMGGGSGSCWWKKLSPKYNRWDENLEGLTDFNHQKESAFTEMVEGLKPVAEEVNNYYRGLAQDPHQTV